MNRFSQSIFALALLGLPMLTGCGGGDAGGSASGLSGTVRIDGSSTVFPITEAVAEEFMIENPGVRVTVGASGTGGGFAKFIRKETDINDASRPIKASEAEKAEAAGVGFVELPVAFDGLAVVVNPQNTFVECLTVEELKKIWAPGSQVRTWDQVRPTFPKQEIRLYGPGTDSGTYDYFTEAVNGEEGASRSDFTASEDDNVLVQGIQGDQWALGYFGMAYYEQNKDRLKLVGIDDGNPANGAGCVLPSAETVRNGQYQPLSRPVFIYVSTTQAQQPQVKAYVDYYLANVGKLAPQVGYVPLSDEAYRLAAEHFTALRTGSVFGSHGSQIGVSLEELLRRERGDTAATADTTAADSAAAR